MTYLPDRDLFPGRFYQEPVALQGHLKARSTMGKAFLLVSYSASRPQLSTPCNREPGIAVCLLAMPNRLISQRAH